MSQDLNRALIERDLGEAIQARHPDDVVSMCVSDLYRLLNAARAEGAPAAEGARHVADAAERLALIAEKPAHLIRWGAGDRLDLQRVLAALSPPAAEGKEEPPRSYSGEEVFDMITAAFHEGCEAVQIHFQHDPDPEFGEAALDYANSIIMRKAYPSAPAAEPVAISRADLEAVRHALVMQRKAIDDLQDRRMALENCDAAINALDAILSKLSGYPLVEEGKA